MRNAIKEPFSNGTEQRAWESCWCEYCVHDSVESEPCLIPTCVGMIAEVGWPECWVPEPDDGHRSLPSRMVCLKFEAAGDDPGVDERAVRIVEVQRYWGAHS